MKETTMSDEIGTIFVEDMHPGLSRSITKVMTDDVIRAFAEVSEDRNPVHLDDAAAAASIFGSRVAHGMLSASLFSALLGERLPGHGTIYLGQNLKFTAPVKVGDAVTATVTVREIDAAKRRVGLDCVAKVGDTVVIKGDATVLAPSRG
jgi:3-hydroxybutyryl-CoA dehydratase